MSRKKESLVRLPRGADIGDDVLYLAGKRIYIEEPAGRRVTKYMQDTETGTVYAITKKRLYLLHILLIIVIAALAYCIYTQPEVTHVVNYVKTAYIHEDRVSLNVINMDTNKYSVKVKLRYEESDLTDWVVLRPGEVVGNADLLNTVSLSPGSYMCKLDYHLIGTMMPNEEEYDVLVIKSEE